jgi:hypothetical protein
LFSLLACACAAHAAAPAAQPALRYLANFCIVQAMTTDAAGNIYIAGQTLSANFPMVHAIQGPTNRYPDAIVAKLDPTGTQILYSTYLGGNGSDTATGIAVDAAGNAYVSGSTESSDFPQTAPTSPPSGGGTFAVKLSPDGSKLLYSRLLGGATSFSQGNAIAIDAAGDAYIAGSSTGRIFPRSTRSSP